MPVQWKFHPLFFQFQLSMSMGWDVPAAVAVFPDNSIEGINHKHILK